MLKKDDPIWLLKFYNESIKNVPLLKYSRFILATIIILAIISFFKLNNSDVFIYAFVVLLISLFGFAISYLIKPKDFFTKIIFYIVLTCIVIVIAIATLGFGVFIISGKPEFYNRWFPPLKDSTIVTVKDTTHHIKEKITPNLPDSFIPKPEGKKDPKPPITTNQPFSDQNTKTDTAKYNTTGEIKLTILPFEYISKDEKYDWLSKGIPETLLNTLVQIKSFIFIEGTQRDKVLKEIDFQQGKYVDIKSAVQIGKILGAQKVIIGSCQLLDRQIKISARVVNIETGTIESYSITEYNGTIDNLFETQSEFSNLMYKKIKPSN